MDPCPHAHARVDMAQALPMMLLALACSQLQTGMLQRSVAHAVPHPLPLLQVLEHKCGMPRPMGDAYNGRGAYPWHRWNAFKSPGGIPGAQAHHGRVSTCSSAV